MNYTERTNAIGTLLRETILPRYKRPDHLDDATARRELADMVEDLNSEWPTMGRDRFEQIAQGIARMIRISHRSRTWPTIGHVIEALRDVLKAETAARASLPRSHGGTDWQEEAKRHQVREWLAGRGACPDHYLTGERLAAIGATPHQMAAARYFAADPRNIGLEPPLKSEKAWEDRGL